MTGNVRSAPPAGLWLTVGVCALLLLTVFSVFGQTAHHAYINFDDDTYVTANSYVRRGISPEILVWICTGSHSGNWHPLASLSHVLDYEIYGLDPTGPHVENVLLHAATAILLFLFLRRATAAFWPSALTAMVFAVHPLRAESVAWVAERKDVLCGLFFMLSLHAYLWHARGAFLLRKYLLLIACFGLGLMCKPMLVTFPVVLLLLDYWPLRRFGRATGDTWCDGRASRFGQLLLEKCPLFVLSLASCAITFSVQEKALEANKHVSLPIRAVVALVSYVEYLGKFLCPVNLGLLYPFPEKPLPFWQAAGAAIVLLTISILAVRLRRVWPFVLVGWLWYLVMLLPVIGLVKVGAHAMADRYTYLPQIGFTIALLWTLARCCATWRVPRWLVGVLAGIAMVLLAVWGARQTAYWQSSETIWRRTLDCAPENVIALNNLGIICAVEQRLPEAIAYWKQALVVDPGSARAHTNLGILLAREGRLEEAKARFGEALRLESTLVQAHTHLARVLASEGAIDEAFVHARRAVELQPADPGARRLLGEILIAGGQLAPAIESFREALRLDPADVTLYGILAWLRATAPDAALRDGREAVTLAEEALRRGGDQRPEAFDTLAAAYAEAGRFPEAVSTAGRAVELARAQAHPAAAAMLFRQDLYRRGQPFHSNAGR